MNWNFDTIEDAKKFAELLIAQSWIEIEVCGCMPIPLLSFNRTKLNWNRVAATDEGEAIDF